MWGEVLIGLLVIYPTHGFAIDSCGVFGECHNCVTFPHCTWVATKTIIGICIDKHRIPFVPVSLTFKDEANCNLFMDIKGKLQKAVSHATINQTTQGKSATLIISQSNQPELETVTSSTSSNAIKIPGFAENGTLAPSAQPNLEYEPPNSQSLAIVGKGIIEQSPSYAELQASKNYTSQVQNDGNVVGYPTGKILREPLVQKMKRASCNALKYFMRLRRTALPKVWMTWNAINPMRNRFNECDSLYKKRKNYYFAKQ